MTQVTKIINSSFFYGLQRVFFYYYPVENETVCVRVGIVGEINDGLIGEGSTNDMSK